MHLCLTCRDTGPGNHSGLSRCVCDLAHALAGRGHSVTLLTAFDTKPAPTLEGVRVARLPVPPLTRTQRPAERETALGNLAFAAAAYREVARTHAYERPVDLVLAPLWRSEGAVCALDGRFPTVVSCMTSARTLSELDPEYRRLADLGERLRLEREALRRCRYLHGLTDAVLAKTISDADLQPSLTAVVNRGLRDHISSQPTPHASSQPDRTVVNADPLVLFVGRFEHRKGVDTLLRAAERMTASGVRARFVVVGQDQGGRGQRAFEAEASEPARAAVRFAGSVGDEELEGLYEAADVVCVPSRYESHGVVLIEAMMHGRAIVTCSAGGISEVVNAGNDALVVPPDSPNELATALGILLHDRSARLKLGAAARAAYERRFRAGPIAAQMEGFFAEVIDKHRREQQPSHPLQALAALVSDVLLLDRGEGSALAAELLDPPAQAWAQWAESYTTQNHWLAERAVAAEHGSAELETNLAGVVAKLELITASRSWRFTAPIRSAAARLRSATGAHGSAYAPGLKRRARRARSRAR